MKPSKFFKISENDNVAIALEDIPKGYKENDIIALDDIPKSHKILLKDLKSGENVIKYNNPIGRVITDLKKGSYIHIHNLKTNLDNKFEYKFSGEKDYFPENNGVTFNGYVRNNGTVGTRNEIWIIPTVGCVNKTALSLEKLCADLKIDDTPCVHAFTHPYGCSQMGEDQLNTRKILSNLINHPNAGGVLVLSLGCENTNIDTLLPYIGDFDKNRIKFLVCQNVDDEIQYGEKLIHQIYDEIKKDKRQKVNIDRLVVGLKCGGSDAFSGITANNLVGNICDRLCNNGATAIMTEVPEMFGAEHILMSRSKDQNVFNKQVKMINGFKDYFLSNNQVCYENPSPGNHDGGITTLEEKSLGCIQKGGCSVITDVLEYGDKIKHNGLNLLVGVGNDIVATTNLASAGAQIILFTTGRGTPLGSVVPTIKISSNSYLFSKKKNWIDFDAGRMINCEDCSEELMNLIIDTASGKTTKNEINGCRDISIFKSGVIL